MNRSQKESKINISQLGFMVTALLSTSANAFTIDLDNGYFFGPGKAIYNETGKIGENRFVDAQIRNIELTGPLVGKIVFSNNGAEEPNVIAEKLQKNGIVDGLASDGTEINENADTALRLNFSDPETGETADYMVIAERSGDPDGAEPILPDDRGNLTFHPKVVADPGDGNTVRFDVVFTTGAAQIPLSLASSNGMPGGVDYAGPLPSGRILIGTLGDYDQDGYLDGTLVLAGNAPDALLVGRGNPIGQIRPWISDIPLDTTQAIQLTVNNILANYPSTFSYAVQAGDIEAIPNYIQGMENGVKALRGYISRMLLNQQSMPHKQVRLLRRSQYQLYWLQTRLQRLNIKMERLLTDSSYVISGQLPSKNIKRISRRVEKILFDIKRFADELSGPQPVTKGNKK